MNEMNFLKQFHLLIFYLLINTLFSQDIKYARTVVNTLASPAMFGRGYVNNGDKIAAKYIVGQFQQFNVRPFNNEYYQQFSLTVNTFPGDWGLGITGKTNYISKGDICIIESTSPNTPLQRCKTILIDSAIINSKKKLIDFEKEIFLEKAIVIDKIGLVDRNTLRSLNRIKQNKYKAACIIVLTEKKSIWTISDTIKSYPTFELNIPDSLHAQWRKKLSNEVYFFNESNYIHNYPSQNVIGYIPGTQFPDSFIVFSAHYDHLGQMGPDVYFPGANDNASGCAMLLNIAKYYSQHPPKYSIALMAFGAEEAGLIGSKHYVDHPLFPLNTIKFLVNLDLIGTGEEGITVVNGTLYKNWFDTIVKINDEKKYLPLIKPRGKASNSDHYHFSEKGVNSFFIYTMGGIKAYHDIYDRAETLPLTQFENVFKLLIDFSEYLQK